MNKTDLSVYCSAELFHVEIDSSKKRSEPFSHVIMNLDRLRSKILIFYESLSS